MKLVWRPRACVVVGPAGTSAPVGVTVPDTTHVGGASNAVTLGLVVLLGSVSLFVPPVLFLNIPILLLRAFLGRADLSRYERVATDAFPCPECGAEVPAEETAGELPVARNCPGCRAVLEVMPKPRVNLVRDAGVT